MRSIYGLCEEVSVVSLGVPLGWDSEDDVPAPSPQSGCFVPDGLISLGLPRASVVNFDGRHYLAGRFMTHGKKGFPAFPHTAQYVDMKVRKQFVFVFR